METHKGALTIFIDKAITVNTKAFHHPKATRQRTITHQPNEIVHGLRAKRDKIPKGIMGRGRLRKATVRFWFNRMNKIRKFHRILNKENRHIITDDIPITLFGINFYRKTAYITRRIF